MTDRPMCICYHGTDAEAVIRIRAEGFRPYTYFAQHLEDAICFGGEYVFEVTFYKDEIADTGWQFKEPESVTIDRIVRLKSYVVVEIYEDKDLGKRIFESNRVAAVIELREEIERGPDVPPQGAGE